MVLSRAAVGHPLPVAFDEAFRWSVAVTAVAVLLALRLPLRRPAG
ncbi:hypothetical protein [Actinoplanes subtropicus]|nr:hypothetical protein [Actinoplanes subtropicus]